MVLLVSKYSGGKQQQPAANQHRTLSKLAGQIDGWKRDGARTSNDVKLPACTEGLDWSADKAGAAGAKGYKLERSEG